MRVSIDSCVLEIYSRTTRLQFFSYFGDHVYIYIYIYIYISYSPSKILCFHISRSKSVPYNLFLLFLYLYIIDGCYNNGMQSFHKSASCSWEQSAQNTIFGLHYITKLITAKLQGSDWLLNSIEYTPFVGLLKYIIMLRVSASCYVWPLYYNAD